MDYQLRQITKDEFEAWLRAISRGFGQHLNEAELEVYRPSVEEMLDRTVAVFDEDEIVGTAHSFPSEMNVPGCTVATAAIAAVTVQPTHRRRGILTRMAAHQLEDIHERGEPLAALFAQESIIYGRFGYGIGSVWEKWEIDRQHTAYSLPHVPEGRIRFVDKAEARTVFPDVYRRALSSRPGAIQRPDARWDILLADVHPWPSGASNDFFVVHEQHGRVDGYALYRTEGELLIVRELLAATNEANASVWRFCFDVDLMASTEAWGRPPDDPLPWLLADSRRLRRSTFDGMWLRLVDVRAALSARRYAAQDKLVLEVRDPFCGWNDGRYELEGGPDGAVCRTTSARPDIVLSAADLAATYLGTVSFTTLSQAGRVEERAQGALPRADAMFATQLQPWNPFGY